MKNNKTAAGLALVFVCLVWGSTFLAVKVASLQFGPFRLAVFRQIPAAAMLFFWAFVIQKQVFPSQKHILRQLFVGFLTIGCWNGMVNWSLLTLPIGLVSLIASLVPAVIALLSHFWSKTERLTPTRWLGIALGFAGLGIIFNDGWLEMARPEYLTGIFLTLGAVLLWAFGTIYAKRFSSENSSPVMDSGLQLLSGGMTMFVASIFYDFFKPLEINQLGWVSLAYVIVFGSVLAMTAYLFALKNLPATIASIYTYINPIIAILLGVVYLGEKMDGPILLGMAVTLGGVYLVNKKS